MKKYESIYHDLLALIESNKIKAGEKLPGEFELQNKYQASRDTIEKHYYYYLKMDISKNHKEKARLY